MEWMFTEARTDFSRLFTHALEDGPQSVIRQKGRKKEAIIIMAVKDFEALAPRPSFKEHLLSIPELPDIPRSKDTGRTVEFG